MNRRKFLSLAAIAPLIGCGPAFPPATIAERWPPIGRFVTVGSTRLHLTDEGEGQPVVLVHGASGNLRDMKFSLAPELARTHRVITIDRPGFGYSERPGGDAWDPALQARLVRGAVRAVGAEKPIILGHSWAGALVLAWAMQFPEELAGVVVLSGATMPWGGSLGLLYSLGASPILGPVVASAVEAFAGPERIANAVDRVFRPQDPPPGYVDFIGGPLSTRPATVRANAEDLDHLNDRLEAMSRDYGSIQLPVEIVHGTSDKIVGAHIHSVPLTRALPRANLTLLPGIGHMPHHVSVPEVAAAVRRLGTA